MKKCTAIDKLRNKCSQSITTSINYRKLILAKYAKISNSTGSRKELNVKIYYRKVILKQDN